MTTYRSNTGGGPPVTFEDAILNGFAADGGLYVPEQLPRISKEMLTDWSELGYIDLAFEVLSLFIDRSTMSASDLQTLLRRAYESFEAKEIIPIHPMRSRERTYVMELFHGPTLSFKDIGQAFLLNLMDFFLQRREARLSLVMATTGDTGPAAAFFAAGRKNLDAWVLYPKGLISEEQERQMTTLTAPNIHSVGVSNCPNGGDDLDLLISDLFADDDFRHKLQLSSVNSINWGRILMQTVHYVYAYLRVVDEVGENIDIAVPSGAFGNLCAGTLTRQMGLPITNFICANNQNAFLHRAFSEGLLSMDHLVTTVSSAIDILLPYNFWRYLYFATGQDSAKIRTWQELFQKNGHLQLDEDTTRQISAGIQSCSISDGETLETIRDVYQSESYLVDPHCAVAVAAARSVARPGNGRKVVCLATAHPAKFPQVITRALASGQPLPEQAKHESIEQAKRRCQRIRLCDYSHVREALVHSMESHQLGR